MLCTVMKELNTKRCQSLLAGSILSSVPNNSPCMFILFLIFFPACTVGEHYLQDFGNLERPIHFLKVLVKDIWKIGFRSKALKICQPF